MADIIKGIYNSSQQDFKGEMEKIKKEQKKFFDIFLTSLKMQDLDNTVDINQMSQQLYQMNELQLLLENNKQLGEINHNFKNSTDFNIAGTLIGKYVVTRSDAIAVKQSQPYVPVSYRVAGESKNVKIQVLDQGDNIIHEEALEKPLADQLNSVDLNFLNAEGELAVPEGIYKAQVLAYDQNKQVLKTEVFTTNRVQQAIADRQFIMDNQRQIKLEDVITMQASPQALVLEGSKATSGMSLFELLQNKNKVST